jgi:hypothetical protein
MQNGPKGQMEEREQYLQSSTVICESSSEHEVPNFPSLLGHTHSEVG